MPNLSARPDKDAARDELWRRAVARLTPRFMLTAPSGVVHEKALAILESTARNLLVLTSRRAAKTETACRLLFMVSAKTANVSSVYLAIVGPQAKKVWARKWKPFLRKNRVPCLHDETDMQTTFPNGSIVQFGGVDDARHVVSLLGDSMAGGVAIIDECQSQPAVVEELVEDVLEPMLSETTAEKAAPGRLVLQGTISKVKAGYFFDLWRKHLDNGSIDNVDSNAWHLFNFSRFDNPFLTDNDRRLRETMAAHGWAADHPNILRDWCGRWDVPDDFGVIHYVRERCAWTPELLANYRQGELPPGELIAGKPPSECDTFGIGLDPAATADRFVIQLIGWSRTQDTGVWHCAEWCTERGANALESQWIEVLKWLKTRYGKIVRVIRDAGSARTTNDLLLRSHGMLIEPAIKGGGSLKARVDRLDDLVAKARFHVISGSKLEEDFRLATWDKRERDKGRWKFDRSHHPDALDAASYIVPAYFESRDNLIQGQILPPPQQAASDATKAFKQNFTNWQAPARQRGGDSALLWRGRG